MQLRQPVVVVLGHVDSGKTSLLDKIRGTAVQAREVGGITQHIGASFFPIETIKEVTGPLFVKLAQAETPIPGLLVIDTPGHEVFANLRLRGGSAADIAIVVADVNKGFEAQTIESIEIDPQKAQGALCRSAKQGGHGEGMEECVAFYLRGGKKAG